MCRVDLRYPSDPSGPMWFPDRIQICVSGNICSQRCPGLEWSFWALHPPSTKVGVIGAGKMSRRQAPHGAVLETLKLAAVVVSSRQTHLLMLQVDSIYTRTLISNRYSSDIHGLSSLFNFQTWTRWTNAQATAQPGFCCWPSSANIQTSRWPWSTARWTRLGCFEKRPRCRVGKHGK